MNLGAPTRVGASPSSSTRRSPPPRRGEFEGSSTRTDRGRQRRVSPVTHSQHEHRLVLEIFGPIIFSFVFPCLSSLSSRSLCTSACMCVCVCISSLFSLLFSHLSPPPLLPAARRGSRACRWPTRSQLRRRWRRWSRGSRSEGESCEAERQAQELRRRYV